MKTAQPLAECFSNIVRLAGLLLSLALSASLLRAADPALLESEAKHRTDRFLQLEREALSAKTDIPTGTLFEKAARTLLQEFPDHREVGASMLIRAAESLPEEQGSTLLAEVILGPYPEQSQELARAIQRRRNAVGKPLEMRFTALDGSIVDLAALKGKVVLIDFWATWCGPCVAQLPNILSTYHTMPMSRVSKLSASVSIQTKSSLRNFWPTANYPGLSSSIGTARKTSSPVNTVFAAFPRRGLWTRRVSCAKAPRVATT